MGLKFSYIALGMLLASGTHQARHDGASAYPRCDDAMIPEFEEVARPLRTPEGYKCLDGVDALQEYLESMKVNKQKYKLFDESHNRLH